MGYSSVRHELCAASPSASFALAGGAFSRHRGPRIMKPSERALCGAAIARPRPGAPYPLGAAWDGEGVNFALFSENATAVGLCPFGGPAGKAHTTPPDGHQPP